MKVTGTRPTTKDRRQVRSSLRGSRFLVSTPVRPKAVRKIRSTHVLTKLPHPCETQTLGT